MEKRERGKCKQQKLTYEEENGKKINGYIKRRIEAMEMDT